MSTNTMAEASAAAEERLIAQDRKAEVLQRLVRARAGGLMEEVWTARDGRPMLVGEMSEDHLRNTLRMIIRMARNRNYAAAHRSARVREVAAEAERQFFESLNNDVFDRP